MGRSQPTLEDYLMDKKENVSDIEEDEDAFKDHHKRLNSFLRQSSVAPPIKRRPAAPRVYKKDHVKVVKDEQKSGLASKKFESYVLSGIEVKFPYAPYPSQFALMEKVIQAAQNGTHALLESPTGTGKTLSLLCSSLAWQRAEKKMIIKLTKEEEKEEGPSGSGRSGQVDAINRVAEKGTSAKLRPLSEEPDAFLSSIHDAPNKAQMMEDMPSKRAKNEKKTPPKMPIIYYGTRTHRQIRQVVEELRTKTPYTPKMTILGSRGQYCIHPKVTQEANRDEACTTLREKTKKTNPHRLDKIVQQMRTLTLTNPELGNEELDEGDEEEANASQGQASNCLNRGPNLTKICAYGAGTPTMSFKMNSSNFLSMIRRECGKGDMQDIESPVWDIEDLVLAGKKAVGCPYYAARELAKGADIVFCPYNYLLHASIREAMGIDLEGNIFIIDEAHNIEDTARSAASLDLSAKALELIENELGELGSQPDSKDILSLRAFIMILRKFINRKPNYTRHQSDLNKEQYIWSVAKFWEVMELDGISRDSVPALYSGLKALKDQKRMAEETESLAPTISEMAERDLGSLFSVLTSMGNSPTAYSIALTTSHMRDSQEPIVTLGFWCLDSGVVFSDFSKRARAVVLTSGTLSPLSTFSSELATEFGLTHEGEHVIKKNQCWAGAISVGPMGTILNGVYQTTQTLAYQDDLGAALLGIAKTVPGGILCFLPSYALLEKLRSRWKVTKALANLGKVKKIFVEPKDNANPFEKALQDYRAACKNPGPGNITGPIMFAVFRGKLSEGIDFRDGECRCVISIGIPYPFFTDFKVVLKKEFNDRNQYVRRMANGGSWYNTQAYRAINQALGRCIRHKDDWGSIIFLEHRFTLPQHHQQISKWVKSSLAYPKSFAECLSSLGSFVNHWENFTPQAPPPCDTNSSSSRQLNVSSFFHQKDPSPSTGLSTCNPQLSLLEKEAGYLSELASIHPSINRSTPVLAQAHTPTKSNPFNLPMPPVPRTDILKATFPKSQEETRNSLNPLLPPILPGLLNPPIQETENPIRNTENLLKENPFISSLSFVQPNLPNLKPLVQEIRGLSSLPLPPTQANNFNHNPPVQKTRCLSSLPFSPTQSNNFSHNPLVQETRSLSSLPLPPTQSKNFNYNPLAQEARNPFNPATHNSPNNSLNMLANSPAKKVITLHIDTYKLRSKLANGVVNPPSSTGRLSAYFSPSANRSNVGAFQEPARSHLPSRDLSVLNHGRGIQTQAPTPIGCLDSLDMSDFSDDCLDDIISDLAPAVSREPSFLQQPELLWTRVICNSCNNFLFTAARLPTLPVELFQLSFPANYLSEYSLFKAGLLTSLSSASIAPVQGNFPPANHFYDQRDGVMYGYFGCGRCPIPSAPRTPLAIRIIFTSPNATTLPPDHVGWLWVHQSLVSQLG